MEKVCCVTGHRDLKDEVLVARRLRDAVQMAIADGYTHFICGFAQGADLLFAKVVFDLMASYPITMEAAIPYRGRLEALKRDVETAVLLDACRAIFVQSEVYHRDVYMKRNAYMVDHSHRVIAVTDGRKKGGTYHTICYAKQQGKQLYSIEI